MKNTIKISTVILVTALALAACEAPTKDEPIMQETYPDLNTVPERPDIPDDQETSKERLQKDFQHAQVLRKSIDEKK